MSIKGCPARQGARYQGRTGSDELVAVTPEKQQRILTGGTNNKLRSIAKQTNRMLRDNGLLKARERLSGVDEVLRNTVE